MRRLSLLRVVRRARLTPLVTVGVVATQITSVLAQTMPMPTPQAGAASPAITQAKALAPAPVPRIVPNRKVPSVTAPALEVKFGATPTAREIRSARVLPDALRSVGDATPEQNRAVALALEQFTADADRAHALDALEGFARGNAAGPWQASLFANLGTLRDQSGFYSRAASLWDQAWDVTRFGESGDAHAIADYAVGKRLIQASTFGQVTVLEARLKEIDTRPVRGPAARDVSVGKEALSFLVYHHDEAIFSGPAALRGWLSERGKATPAALRAIAAYQPTHEGTSLATLATLAGQSGIRMSPRWTDDLDALPLPAIVHFKSNHYSLLVAREPGGYRLRDVALGGEAYLTVDALRDEMSGYVVVPDAAPLAGRSVEADEASRVFGHCFPGLPADSQDCCDDNAPPPGESPEPKNPSLPEGPPSDPSNSGSGPACGMPEYMLHRMTASVLVSDIPLRYDPPKGPSVEFRLRYNQRWSSGGGTTVDYGNVGANWRHDWIGYVVDNNSSAVAPYVWTDLSERGVGAETYNSYTGNTHWRTRATLTQVSQNPPRYERVLPDGTMEVYTFPDRGPTAANRKIFITEVISRLGQSLNFTYDESIRLVAVTDALGQVTTLEYQDPVSPMLLTKVTDPFGRTAAMTYNDLGQLTSITDAIGMTSRFAYDETDFMRAMTTPYGTTQFRNEDVSGASAHRAITVTDPEGGKEHIEYWATSAVGLPSTADAGEVPVGYSDMNQSLNLFNSLYWGKQAMEEAPGDRSHAVITRWLVKNEGGYAAHASGMAIPHSIKRPLENRVWFRYPDQPNANTAGTGKRPNQIARVLGDGTTQISQYGYNANGWLTSETDPLGRQRTYTYAANNIDLLEVRQTRPGGSDLLAAYGSYNALHLPASVTDAAGQNTTLTYSAAGQILTATNAKSETTTFTYDTGGYGYLQSITGALSGATVSLTYDAYGRRQSMTAPDGYTVSTTYDGLNRVTRTTYPDGTFDGVIYDKLDVAEATDRAGRVTRYFHNRNRQLTARRDPLGRVVRQDWCGCGHIEALVDGAGNRTNWSYDARGRLAAEVRAGGATTTYTYDPTGRLQTVTNPKEEVTTYAYAADDRVLSVSYSNTAVATPTVTFTYDTVYSRATTMVDGIGTTTYTYMSSGQLGAGQIATVDGPFSNDVIAYAFDELGRVVNRTINGSANSVTWTFDSLGRMASEQSALGTFNYAYDGATNRLATLSYPNGQTSTYSYLPNAQDRRLQTIHHKYPGGATLSKFDYTYDVVGSMSTWRQQADASAVQWSYGYDAADQLVQAVKSNTDSTPVILQRFAYGYDSSANRTTEQIDDAVVTSNVDSRNELVSQQPGGTLVLAGTVNEPATMTIAGSPVTVSTTGAFRGSARVATGTNTVAVTATDASGNSATRSYSIGQAGGSKNFTYDDNGNMASDGTRTFEWDGANRLVAVTLGSHRSEFSYDGSDRRVRLVEKESGLTVRDEQLIWAGTTLAEERLSTGEVNRFVANGEQHGGVSWYLTRDHLGSVREIANSAGTLLIRNDYDAFGRMTRVVGTEDSRFSYTGHLAHGQTGLILAQYRAYDADLGRWISSDPSGLAAGENLSAYVANNPVGFTDPFGLCEEQSAQGQFDPDRFGPADPTDPTRPLIDNPVVKKAANEAFMRTLNGTARSGLAEAGFSIEYRNGVISIGTKVDSVQGDGIPNQLEIQRGPNTIAILHTHGNGVKPAPSAGDLGSPVPNFVFSRQGIYVTKPETGTYTKIK